MDSIERVTAPPWGPLDQAYREHLARYLWAAPFTRAKAVLDVACGSGFGAHRLAAGALSVTGLDVSSEAVGFARRHYAHPGLAFVQGNALALPFAAGSFDAVVSFETLEHLSDAERFLAEVRRVLRPGGLALLSTPDREILPLFTLDPAEYRNPFHTREYTLPELRELLERQFARCEFHGQCEYAGAATAGAARGVAARLAAPLRGFLGEELKLRIKRRMLGASESPEIFPLEGRRAKYLLAVCRPALAPPPPPR